eukprot:TRINITY_DN5486_c0_g1_i1.p1 TRINITY_DN5486_c0_g1~~TRINITY_DN5486_c0_g1_i1.p1  ORF type:complete len:160 (+),score=58.06 TRINITY_DN5486_c0_g1_i1:26-505(+)
MDKVPINSLTPEQLGAAKERVDEEIQFLSSSLQTLRQARDRFQDSKQCLQTMKQYNPGDKVLVPLTSSLYVNGQFGDLNQVLVDVGTGYFIKQSNGKAQEFMDRKMGFLKENIDKVQEALQLKRKQQELIITEMQRKIMQEQERQEKQQSAGAAAPKAS